MNHTHTYRIKAMFGKDIDLDVDIWHFHCPGDRDTPKYEETEIEGITKDGRPVSTAALERYFSILHGCHMNYETIAAMIIEDFEKCHENMLAL